MRYRTVSLSAYAGQHYTANYGTLAFVPGQTTTNVSVTASAPSTAAYRYQTGVHAKGNDLYVSVAFNEPVTCSSVSLTTTWGTLSHNSGSGSNVLTFKGVFDGRGYTVSGIRIYKGGSGTADGKQGLFGRTSDGTVRNVTLADARITGSSSVGGIVGEAYSGEVSNCFVLDVALPDVENSGAIVGYNNNNATLAANYYHACTVAGTANAIGVGIEVDGGGATVRVAASAGGEAVDMERVNGVFCVEAGENPVNLVPKAVQAGNVAYGSGEAQVFVPASDGSFISVSIDTATPAR